LSPMSVWFVLLGALLVRVSGRNLPPREARWITGMVAVAILVRTAMIAALFLFGTPDRVHASFNVFFGDEQYMIMRAFRQRAVWLNASMRADAFADVFEVYGRTSYLTLIALVQMLVGESPYGVRLLNILIYAAAGLILHRIVRRAYGRVPAFGTLAFLLFLPSLILWSTAALKESLNFLIVMSTLTAAIMTVRAAGAWRLVAAVGVCVGLAALATLRDGAVEIALLGLAIGAVGAFAMSGRSRFAIAIVVAAVLIGPALRSSRLQASAMDAFRASAKKHQGHVYTRGHSYLLLDEPFYGRRSLTEMTWSDAFRYMARSAISVVVFPAPWQIRSLPEAAFLPEQLIWYAAVFTAAIGFVAGLRRDPLVTCMFAGYAAVALMVVGLNTGNMGTLVRHRAFALPYLGALSALGLTVILSRFAPRETRHTWH
jgi:4-amino-4-deoxy-L-arabinose transferase-like glycosyltransferase